MIDTEHLKPKVGVMKFEVSKKVDPDVGEICYERLLQKRVNSGKFIVVDWEEIGRVLKVVSKAQPNVSEDDAKRMAIKQLGIERMYVGSVRKLGRRFYVTIKVLNLDLTVEKVEKGKTESEDALEALIDNLAPSLIYTAAELDAGREKMRRAAAEEKRRQYAIALWAAKDWYKRAEGRPDPVRWMKVKALAEAAIKTGYPDNGEAKRLLAEARKHIPLPGWTVSRERIKVMTPGGEATKALTYYKNPLGMEFVRIPAGEFMMGSPGGESGRDDDEKLHRVRIAQAFYMQAHEVTNGQYQAFLKASGCDGSGDADSDYLKHFKGNSNMPTGAAYPMVWVIWKNAQAFCRWLSKRGRVPYRLPTEAEWGYACRAGNRTRFYSGDEDSPLDRTAWYTSNSGGKTHEVGQKLPNAFGLFDMSGNVLEWCQSLLKSYPYLDRDGREDLSSGGSRVLRGGSWVGVGVACGSAVRCFGGPADRGSSIGFRVVASPPPQE